jgi:hypothetical protein
MRRLAGGESQSVTLTEQQSASWPKADRLFDDDTACSDIDPDILDQPLPPRGPFI